MRQSAQGSRTVTAAMAASAVIFAVPATAAVVSGSDGPRGERDSSVAGKPTKPPINADTLDSLDSTDFLRVTGKAADADALDGLDSVDFLGVGAKAVDADKLDGLDSTDLMRGGGLVRTRIRPLVSAGQASGTYITTVEGSPAEPGFGGAWLYFCPTDPTTTGAEIRYENRSMSATDVYVSRVGSSGTWFETVPAGGYMFIRDAAPVNAGTSLNNGDLFTWTFVNQGVNRLVTAQTTSRRTPEVCSFTSQATETPIFGQ